MKLISVSINGLRVVVSPALPVREDQDGIWEHKLADLSVLAHASLVKETPAGSGRGTIDNVDLDLKEGLFRPPQATNGDLALVEITATPWLEPIAWPKLCVKRGTQQAQKVAVELLVMTAHEQLVLAPISSEVLEWDGVTLVSRGMSLEETLNPAVTGLQQIARLLREDNPDLTKMKELLFEIEQVAAKLDLTRFSFVRAAAAIAAKFDEQHSHALAADCYRAALETSYSLPGEDSATITRLRDYYVAQVERLEKELAAIPTPATAATLAERYHALSKELKTAHGERLHELSLELKACNAQIAALNVSGQVRKQRDLLAAKELIAPQPLIAPASEPLPTRASPQPLHKPASKPRLATTGLMPQLATAGTK